MVQAHIFRKRMLRHCIIVVTHCQIFIYRKVSCLGMTPENSILLGSGAYYEKETYIYCQISPFLQLDRLD